MLDVKLGGGGICASTQKMQWIQEGLPEDQRVYLTQEGPALVHSKLRPGYGINSQGGREEILEAVLGGGRSQAEQKKQNLTRRENRLRGPDCYL